jgi:hypothetical protein
LIALVPLLIFVALRGDLAEHGTAVLDRVILIVLMEGGGGVGLRVWVFAFEPLLSFLVLFNLDHHLLSYVLDLVLLTLPLEFLQAFHVLGPGMHI